MRVDNRAAANTVMAEVARLQLARPAKAEERPSKSATEGAKRDAVSLGAPLLPAGKRISSAEM